MAFYVQVTPTKNVWLYFDSYTAIKYFCALLDNTLRFVLCLPTREKNNNNVIRIRCVECSSFSAYVPVIVNREMLVLLNDLWRHAVLLCIYVLLYQVSTVAFKRLIVWLGLEG